ncbi:MAG: hypothetical protein ACYC2K_18825, partial [Gemmatimonadales bacterium]
KVVHKSALRESAEVRVEVIAESLIRLGLWRRSPASTDPDDFALASGFALSVADAKELRGALGLAIAEVEAANAR